MGDLREKTLLAKGMCYIFVPVVLFGTASFIFPGVYAAFPVQESAICICSFYEMQVHGHNSWWLFELNQRSFQLMTLANSISFYLINWCSLLILIWLVYRIRHTRDDTNLKRECVCIVAIWVFCSVIQYCVFIFNYIVACNENTGKLEPSTLSDYYTVSYKLVYWLIMGRDLACLITMLVF